MNRTTAPPGGFLFSRTVQTCPTGYVSLRAIINKLLIYQENQKQTSFLSAFIIAITSVCFNFGFMLHARLHVNVSADLRNEGCYGTVKSIQRLMDLRSERKHFPKMLQLLKKRRFKCSRGRVEFSRSKERYVIKNQFNLSKSDIRAL